MGVKGPQGILEASLYATDLAAARQFYEGVLGLECVAYEPPRHAFFRAGRGMLLVFDPRETARSQDVPAHGASGPGHVALSVAAAELEAWAARLEAAGVAVRRAGWPGGESLFFRDPAGNLLELAPPQIWGIS
jgi:catechol 2,3-dioxygenase-like lactoylglutathione lyase family enzyme